MMTADLILATVTPQTGALFAIGSGAVVTGLVFLVMAVVMVAGVAGELRASAARGDASLPAILPASPRLAA